MGHEQNPPVIQADNRRNGAKSQFKKGDARINRKGRPKTADQLRKMLLGLFNEEIDGENGTRVTRLNQMVMAMMMGQPAERKELLERAFGKVPQPTELTGKDGGAIEFKPNLTSLSDAELEAYIASGRSGRSAAPTTSEE